MFIVDPLQRSEKMSTQAEETEHPTMSIARTIPVQSSVDHNYVACLECRFKGTWQADSAGHYIASGDDAELRILRIDGAKKYLTFKNGARVSVLCSNMLTYEQNDVEEDVNVEEEAAVL